MHSTVGDLLIFVIKINNRLKNVQPLQFMFFLNTSYLTDYILRVKPMYESDVLTAFIKNFQLTFPLPINSSCLTKKMEILGFGVFLQKKYPENIKKITPKSRILIAEFPLLPNDQN